MTAEEAVNAINYLIEVETDLVKQVNTARGISQKVLQREKRAIRTLFRGLVGREPTEEEIEEMTDI